MKVQEPSASTARSRRTITFRLDILRMPIARATVSATGRPSGMTETASATASKNTSVIGVPRIAATANIVKAAMPTNIATRLVKLSIRICNGALGDGLNKTSAAIRPSAVLSAVLITTPRARPRPTRVPVKSMLTWSPRATSSANTALLSFSTGSDSPVSKDSSTSRSRDRSRRKSAGTLSPDSSSTMSPGTNSSALISCVSPSRSTWQRVLTRSRRAVAARCAEYS